MRARRAAWIHGLVACLLIACNDGGPPAPDAETAATLDQALLDRNPLTRAHGLSGALLRMQREDLDEALATLERRQFGVTPEELRLFMLAWADFDPAGALAWARTYPGAWSSNLADAAAFAWGYRDGASAFAAVEGIEDEKVRARLRSSVMDGWIRSDDKSGVAANIAARDDPRPRRRLTFTLVAEIRTQGLDVLEQWVEALPDDMPNSFKQGAFYHASVVVAREDPERAAGWLARNADRDYSLGAAAGIARRWADTGDYEGLFAWARALPVDSAERRTDRDDALADGFRAWIRADVDAAETWLAASMPDPVLDPAVAELARKRTYGAPADAVDWAMRIEDEKLRQSVLRPALVALARADASAARHWLDEHEMPESFRNGVLKEARGPAPRERVLNVPEGS